MTLERVIDASIAVKWLFKEHDSEAAIRLTGAASGLIAPSLLLIESANAIRGHVRRGSIGIDAGIEMQASLPRYLRSIIDDRDLFIDALRLSIALDHPVYDCVYLALAHQRGMKLVTADDRFLRKIANTSHAARVESLAAFA